MFFTTIFAAFADLFGTSAGPVLRNVTRNHSLVFVVPQDSLFFATIFAVFADLFGISAEPALKTVTLNRPLMFFC